MPGSRPDHRAEEYDILNNSQRALSGLGSVGNLTGIGNRGDLGQSYSRMQQQMDKKRVQSASIKKLLGQVDAAKADDDNLQRRQMEVRSPKPGATDPDLFSSKAVRNVGLKMERSKEGTRNSVVLKMSSIFKSKNDASGHPVEGEGEDEDGQSRMVKVYYQKADQAEPRTHKPRVGG